MSEIDTSQLIVLYLPANSHESCFGRYLGHVHVSIIAAFPSSVLCNPLYIYRDAFCVRLKTLCVNSFAAFKITTLVVYLSGNPFIAN